MNPRLDAARVAQFFRSYLHDPRPERERLIAVVCDRDFPDAFWRGLESVGTLRRIDLRQGGSPRRIVEGALHAGWYVSVHEYLADHFLPAGEQLVSLTHHRADVDYTSFEFPRNAPSAAQIEHQLALFTSQEPGAQARAADRFFALLGGNLDYRIEVRSGTQRDRSLVIPGPAPWMEICGPLWPSAVRFAPGAELFHRGQGVRGVLQCSGALNLLPLRGPYQEPERVDALLALGRRLPDDPIDLHVEDGRVVAIMSQGGLGAGFTELLADDPAFATVVEVGIGLSFPPEQLVRDWPATSNEAAIGVHLGIGADPGDVGRFRTPIHVDFVSTDLEVLVNGSRYLANGAFS